MPRCPKRISIAILMTMTSRPRRRKKAMERDHGALLRRAETRHRVQGAASGDGGARHSSAGLRRHLTRAKAARETTTTPTSTPGSTSLDEPPELLCVAALASTMRRASEDP
jgi:hypothetical protein